MEPGTDKDPKLSQALPSPAIGRMTPGCQQGQTSPRRTSSPPTQLQPAGPSVVVDMAPGTACRIQGALTEMRSILCQETLLSSLDFPRSPFPAY